MWVPNECGFIHKSHRKIFYTKVSCSIINDFHTSDQLVKTKILITNYPFNIKVRLAYDYQLIINTFRTEKNPAFPCDVQICQDYSMFP